MTVASSTSRAQYNCSGGTTYTFSFGVGETSEIKVILTDGLGIPATLTETTHYSVSATNNDFSSGGTVTTVAAYDTPYTITILRNVPITQSSDYVEGMESLYETFEDGLDKLTRIDQQQQEILNRALTIPEASSATTALSALVANGYLRVNSTGDGFEFATLVETGAISDEAYNQTTWSAADDTAPSKKAVSAELELKADKSGETITGATLTTSTINGLTPTAAAVGFTLAGGTTSKTLTVSDTLTLALGAANLKQFMNAAGAALEWGLGLKIVAYTRDMATASGTVSYTGAGFKPGAVIVFAMIDGNTLWSIGMGTHGASHHIAIADTGSAIGHFGNALIYMRTTGTNFQYTGTPSMTADGMDLAWTKGGTPTATITFYALYIR
jgi:hypothetical protein